MAINVTTDVVWDAENGLTADVYENDLGSRAALLDIHGGGWFRGDKAKEAGIATRFAQEGYLVVVPNYRLAPTSVFPAARDDVIKAFTWMRDSSYEFDRSRMAVFGSSAGGTLSVDVGLEYGVPAVSWSGIFDAVEWFAAHRDVVPAPDTKTDFVNAASAQIDQGGANDSFYKWFILGYVGQDESLLPQLEPFDRIAAAGGVGGAGDAGASAPGPMLLVNSLREIVPVSGVEKLQAALADVGVPATVQLIAGTDHAEGYEDRAWAETVQFLARALRR